jgi:hypothetical protein
VSLGKANFGANGCLSKIEPFADVDGDIAAFSLYSYEPPKEFWATWKVVIDDGVYTGGNGAMPFLMILFIILFFGFGLAVYAMML